MPQAARGLVLRPIQLENVLWLGGMPGVGKSTAARLVARRYPVRLYLVDLHTYEHAARLPADPRTLDEIWVDSNPEELAAEFEAAARARWPLILEELASLPDEDVVLVEGPQLLPELVAAAGVPSANALYVVADTALQRALVAGRSSDLYARTRDPRCALANRVARDAVLARRYRAPGLPTVTISAVEETAGLVEHRFADRLRAARGDVPALRRALNDDVLRQVRLHVDAIGADGGREVVLECECGCGDVLRLPLDAAESQRRARRPLGHGP